MPGGQSLPPARQAARHLDSRTENSSLGRGLRSPPQYSTLAIPEAALPIAHTAFIDMPFECDHARRQHRCYERNAVISQLASVRVFNGALKERAISLQHIRAARHAVRFYLVEFGETRKSALELARGKQTAQTDFATHVFQV